LQTAQVFSGYRRVLIYISAPVEDIGQDLQGGCGMEHISKL
jgi:hypothetical protein